MPVALPLNGFIEGQAFEYRIDTNGWSQSSHLIQQPQKGIGTLANTGSRVGT